MRSRAASRPGDRRVHAGVARSGCAVRRPSAVDVAVTSTFGAPPRAERGLRQRARRPGQPSAVDFEPAAAATVTQRRHCGGAGGVGTSARGRRRVEPARLRAPRAGPATPRRARVAQRGLRLAPRAACRARRAASASVCSTRRRRSSITAWRRRVRASTHARATMAARLRPRPTRGRVGSVFPARAPTRRSSASVCASTHALRCRSSARFPVRGAPSRATIGRARLVRMTSGTIAVSGRSATSAASSSAAVTSSPGALSGQQDAGRRRPPLPGGSTSAVSPAGGHAYLRRRPAGKPAAVASSPM